MCQCVYYSHIVEYLSRKQRTSIRLNHRYTSSAIPMTQPTPRMLGAPDGSVSLATGRGVASLEEDVVEHSDDQDDGEDHDQVTGHPEVPRTLLGCFLTCADFLPELGKPFPRRITKLVDNEASSAHRFTDCSSVNHSFSLACCIAACRFQVIDYKKLQLLSMQLPFGAKLGILLI